MSAEVNSEHLSAVFERLIYLQQCLSEVFQPADCDVCGCWRRWWSRLVFVIAARSQNHNGNCARDDATCLHKSRGCEKQTPHPAFSQRCPDTTAESGQFVSTHNSFMYFLGAAPTRALTPSEDEEWTHLRHDVCLVVPIYRRQPCQLACISLCSLISHAFHLPPLHRRDRVFLFLRIAVNADKRYLHSCLRQ